MLNDDLAMSDVNPFADPNLFTPGVRYNGGPYVPKLPYGKPPKETVAQWDKESPSIGCQLTRSAGNGTASYCTPKTSECPLERPLLPMRLINPGFTALADKEAQLIGKGEAERRIKRSRDIGIPIILGLILLYYLIYSKSFDM
jgi:hypothetical protein